MMKRIKHDQTKPPAGRRYMSELRAGTVMPGDPRAGSGPRQRYVDTPAAAAFLGVSESYLNKARHFGTGPDYVRFGRAIRYDLHVLEQWAKARSVSTCVAERD